MIIKVYFCNLAKKKVLGMVAKLLAEISGSACKVRVECNYGNDACKARAINVRNLQPKCC